MWLLKEVKQVWGRLYCQIDRQQGLKGAVSETSKQRVMVGQAEAYSVKYRLKSKRVLSRKEPLRMEPMVLENHKQGSPSEA